MILTETMFQNLYSLLSQTKLLNTSGPNMGKPGSTPAFLTTGRKLPQVSAISQAIQPALYMLEGEQDVSEKAFALPVYELQCAAVVFFRDTGGDQGIPSTQMNNLRDAVIYQMREQTLAADGTTVVPLLLGNKQTLGGVVYHARVKGRVLANEGLQNNQGALVFPISILNGGN